MAELQYGSSASASHGDRSWDSVREAICQRWPQINRDELKSCDESAKALAEFVSLRVQDDVDEVRTLIGRHAPESDTTFAYLAESASDQARRASKAVSQAYQRAESQVQQYPTESTAVAFITGVILGGVAATLYFTSRPQPSLWQNVQDGFRRS